MSTFVPLTELKQIDEGLFLDECDQTLTDISEALAKFIRKHGDQATGASAEMTIKVKLKCTDADQGIYAITSGVSHKVPSQPARVTTALGDFDALGRSTILIRKSGSDDGDPRQRKLSTRDGRTVDPETGDAEDDE